jgi:hypothetical protein
MLGADEVALGGKIEGDDGRRRRHLFRWSKALLACRLLRHRPFPVLHVALRRHLVHVLRRAAAHQGGGIPPYVEPTTYNS